jgi:hypothetical protein
LDANQKISAVLRIADNAIIPMDTMNTDYQEYLQWVDAGNTPLPAEELS